MTPFRLLPAALPLCAALLAAAPVFAQDHAKDEAFIRNAIKQTDAAAEKKDAKGVVAFTHPDYVGIDKDGKEVTHGKAEREAKMARLFSDAVKIITQTKVTRIRFTSDGATVESQSGGTILLAKGDRKATMKGSSTSRDLWVKVKNGWLEKRTRGLTSTLTVNGKPVQ